MQTLPRMQWGVKIALRDGTLLSATVYLPEHQVRPAPVIVTLTPYVAQTYHDQALYFASNGYPFVAVDARGRGNSEGEFRPLIQEATDGYDVVEWISQQGYCDGQVAMWGGSYAGYDQWVVAREHPPHLATIAPVAAPFVGVDFPIRNNIASPYLMQWLTLVSGRTSQDRIFWNNELFWRGRYRQWFESGKAFKSLDVLFGNPSPVFQEWVTHPKQDAYWDRYNPTAEDYAGIDLPVLTITGIYDADQPGALRHYVEHLRHGTTNARARHFLVIGPWDHAGTRVPQAEFCGINAGVASVLDLGKLHLQWYAWTMQGGQRPEFLRQKVAYYVLGSNRWRYSDTLEAITREHRSFYLDSTGSASSVFSSGILMSESGKGEADRYIYDPQDTCSAEMEVASKLPMSLRPTFPVDDLTDQAHVLVREGKQLVYHSAPFDREVEVSGFFKLTVWISIDQPDTDFRASVYEIALNGSSLLLSSDCIRARHRQGPREEELIVTTDPLPYHFEGFTFASRRVSGGSRLRLVIGPVSSIYFEKNYNSGRTVADETVADARGVTVTLYHDQSRPSALCVPLAQPQVDEF